MGQSPTPRQIREIEAALKLAALKEREKEFARMHLLRIQSLLSRTIPLRRKD